MYMIKIFMGGGGNGWWMGECSSERCLMWSGGVGVIKGSFQNILKQGVGKGKSCSQGEGALKVSSPLPPSHENFNHTLWQYIIAI